MRPRTVLLSLHLISACSFGARPAANAPTSGADAAHANHADGDVHQGRLRVGFITLERLIARYGLREAFWNREPTVRTSGGGLRHAELLAAADRAADRAEASALRYLATRSSIEARGVWVDDRGHALAALPAVIGVTAPRDRVGLAAAFDEAAASGANVKAVVAEAMQAAESDDVLPAQLSAHVRELLGTDAPLAMALARHNLGHERIVTGDVKVAAAAYPAVGGTVVVLVLDDWCSPGVFVEWVDDPSDAPGEAMGTTAASFPLVDAETRRCRGEPS